MKVTYLVATTAALICFTGCMHNRQSNSGQGAASTEQGVGSARATQPPEAEQPLSRVDRASQLIGEPVLTSDHLRTGKLANFEIDQESGRILYAIVQIGGVLGVGGTDVAVPPEMFTEAKKGTVELKVDKAKLGGAPRVPSNDNDARKADFVGKVYSYFGQTGFWQGKESTAMASFTGSRKATDLIGMTVMNNSHQEIGKVEEIALDVPGGREVYVIISPSSDMSLGNNYYALPARAAKLTSNQKGLTADVTREKLSNGPHFPKDDWSEMANATWAQRVYQYYGQQFTPSNPQLQPTGRTNQVANPKR
jgi:sporulation protein YlmC with PRC-barrel domain